MGRSGQPITLNKYLYANADPVLYVDPTGNFGSLSGANASLGIMGVLAATSISSYQLGQNLASGGTSTGGFSNSQVGWLALATMVGTQSSFFELIVSKAKQREDNNETVDLARAVGLDEYYDIASCDCFRSSQSLEDKRFWVGPNSEQTATAYGTQFYGLYADWTIVSLTISERLFRTLDHTQMDEFLGGQSVTVNYWMLGAITADAHRYGGIRY